MFASLTPPECVALRSEEVLSAILSRFPRHDEQASENSEKTDRQTDRKTLFFWKKNSDKTFF